VEAVAKGSRGCFLRFPPYFFNEQNFLFSIICKRGNVLVQGAICLLSFVLVVFPFISSSLAEGPKNPPLINPLSKITFNLEQFNEHGLYGPPDGLRALHYEFCIPGDPVTAAQVRQIDPNIEISPTSRGRIGCTEGEYLCLGNTHQPNFKAVLFTLAKLPYVKRIDQAFFE
jgi:hypothetical protein